MDNSRDLKDLHDAIEQAARDAIAAMNAELKKIDPALEVKPVQVYRSAAYQNKLYAQGRTAPGSKVTNAKGGQSAHNTDLPHTPDGDSEAFDIGVFRAGTYLQGNNKAELDLYLRCGPIGKSFGFVWGGDFKSFKDYPHFERAGWKEKA